METAVREITRLASAPTIASTLECGSTSFEVELVEPSKSAYKIYFVQCAVCGGVVGVLDFYNIGARLIKQDEALKKIAQKIGAHVDLA